MAAMFRFRSKEESFTGLLPSRESELRLQLSAPGAGASAIRELLKRGMAAEGFGEALDGARSKDFSVAPDEAAE
jgi:hypothetical protein